MKECHACKTLIELSASRCIKCGERQIGFLSIFSSGVMAILIVIVFLALLG